MSDLIEALQIFLKYGNPYCPTDCQDCWFNVLINPDAVSEEDKSRLGELGFFVDNEHRCFSSYRFS